MKVKKFAIRLIIVLLVISIFIFVLMRIQIDELEKHDFHAIEIADLPDGIYRGGASAVLVSAKVEVIVSDGHILKITLLEHSHGPGYGAEMICEDIVEFNSLDVDSISGATASSTVVRAAVLEALKSGKTP